MEALFRRRAGSSASHLYGRPVTSSETWTWLPLAGLRAHPVDHEGGSDLHSLERTINWWATVALFAAPQAGEPGWHFYAAAVFNQHNPWWIVMPISPRTYSA